jgi:dihydroorotase
MAFEILNGLTKLPGLCDVHVHFREPGFSYKETIKTGSLAAKAGGFTAVCAMPNLNPVPDSIENIKLEQDIIDRDACIAVYPYAAITVGEGGEKIADLEGLAPHCIAFSDDGHGVSDEGLMREAMERIRDLGKLLAAHCELFPGDYSPESEWKEIERDVKLAAATGCAYHVCHISTKESVSIIRDAKKSGVDITCETAPHYLTLCNDDVLDEGRFKMNPPLRTIKDKEALLLGVLDGTIDMVATDHAPHSAEEKSKGFAGSLNGIVGLETAFPVLYTDLVKTQTITLDRLVELMSTNPRRRFNIPLRDDFTLWALDEEFIVDPSKFLTMGRSTPFEGRKLFGVLKETYYSGI